MAKSTDQWVADLADAVAEYRAARTPVPAGLYRIDELPERTPAEEAAWQKMRTLGEEIHAEGGPMLMRAVHEEAAYDKRCGKRWAETVSLAWHGIAGWVA